MPRLRQLWNAAVCRSDYLLGREICRGRPRRLYLELTNHCNAQCAMCPTNREAGSVRKGYMSHDTFVRYIDAFSSYALRLSLHNWGEPLLHPEVCELVAYAIRAGLYVKFSTNLTCLTDALAKGLVRSGLHALTVSIHAASCETYRKYTGVDRFETAVGNIERLLSCRKALNSTLPRVTWFYVVHRYNEGELGAARALAKCLGVDSFFALPMRTMMHHEVLLSTQEKLTRYGEWVPESAKYNRYQDAGPVRRRKCSWPWERLVVDWDGSIYPCCLAFGDSAKLVRRPTCSPEGLWNSEPFISARRACRGSAAGATLCATCFGTGYTDFV